MKKKLKLFKVSFKNEYDDDAFVLAYGFDEAAEKGLIAKTLEDSEDEALIDSDGSLNMEVKKYKVEKVEFLKRYRPE